MCWLEIPQIYLSTLYTERIFKKSCLMKYLNSTKTFLGIIHVALKNFHECRKILPVQREPQNDTVLPLESKVNRDLITHYKNAILLVFAL